MSKEIDYNEQLENAKDNTGEIAAIMFLALLEETQERIQELKAREVSDV
jgi:hypothetical protein